MLPTTETTIIRPSALSGYGDCPRREAARLFRFEVERAGYKLRETPGGVAPVIGTATHAATARIVEEKLRSGNLGDLEEAEQAGIEKLGLCLEQETHFDKTSPTRKDAEIQVRRMTRAYHRHIAPVLNPVAVESRLEAKIGKGFLLAGTSDVETIEPGVIRDTKTGVVSRTHAAQLGGYSLLSRSHGRVIAKGVIDFIKRVPVRTDQPPPVTSDYPVADIENLAMHRIKRIQRDLTEFRHRVHTDAGPPEFAFDVNPMSNLCSDRWCPAWGTKFCAEWRYKETSS